MGRGIVARRVVLTTMALLIGAVGAVAPATAQVPDDVTEWFLSEAPDHLDPEVVTTPEDVAFGVPRVASVWTDSFRAGEPDTPIHATIQLWIAPLYVESDGAMVPMGTMRVHRAESGDLAFEAVDTDAELAGAILGLATGLPVVIDGETEGWYSTDDSRVWPLDGGAREHLRGSVPVGLFQAGLQERDALDEGEGIRAGADSEESSSPVVWIGLGIVLVLAAAAIAVAIVQRHRRADARIAAEVAAAVDPPEITGPDLADPR